MFRGVGLPAPDSPGGLAILASLVLGVVYLLLLVGAYSALSSMALWFVSLNLLLAVVTAFFLVSMVSSDTARATEFELEFARSVQAHLAAGETLVESSPLGGILREYARAAGDARRSAREHAYAAGPATWSALLAVTATLLVGLAYVGGAIPNVIGVALVFELVAFVLLALSAGVLGFSVGRSGDVVGFDVLVLRRWARVAHPSFPFTHALTEVPWAVEGGHLPSPPPPAGAPAPSTS